MPRDPIPGELVNLLHAISDDGRLREWLLSLRQLPDEVRRTELGSMAARMQAAGEDAAIIAAISALAQPRLYDAACRTLREL